LKFLVTARIGDTITARVKVTRIQAEKNRITLKTTCTNQDDTLVMDGEALISFNRKRNFGLVELV
jgi:3-hydroxybutyryl-CoA dehydratase